MATLLFFIDHPVQICRAKKLNLSTFGGRGVNEPLRKREKSIRELGRVYEVFPS